MQFPHVKLELGKNAEACSSAWREFCEAGIHQRIWDKDHTVWANTPDQISNRLGWLDCPLKYRQQIPALQTFAQQVRDTGITQFVLLGMGGSSLGADVFAKAVGSAPGYPKLTVLDSTHPQMINDTMGSLDLSRSLFIVSTKSGSTVETMSLFKYCYNEVGKALGYSKAGARFVAITDPGSQLEALAKQHDFRKVFLNDANIGGRYSVLSCFGLVPAALLGLDLDMLLQSAEAMASIDKQTNTSLQGGAYLGVVLGALAKLGRNKLTVISDPRLAPFGIWLEQLIAESSGKQGRGVLPVLADSMYQPQQYAEDRAFLVLEFAGEPCFHDEGAKLADAGIPVIRISLPDIQGLGAEFFRWQMATACLCHVIGVNPFDQPDVESAKQATRAIVKKGARLKNPDRQSIEVTLKVFTENTRDAKYISVLAYLNPTQENKHLLNQLCTAIRKLTPAPVSLGFGSRYLHSTGQLHKGGMAGGRYLIFTEKCSTDLDIPDEAGNDASSLTFGSLLNAQASGDETALKDAGRQVFRAHFDYSREDGLRRLLDGLASR